jgi:enoyl-CoA hydratase
MEILLTGETIDAQTALRVGLVNAVVPTDEVLPRAMAYAHRIARNSPKSVRQIKRSVMYTSGEPLERAYAIEAEHSRSVFGSRDAVEGPMAFLEKRAPKFGDAELTEAREED